MEILLKHSHPLSQNVTARLGGKRNALQDWPLENRRVRSLSLYLVQISVLESSGWSMFSTLPTYSQVASISCWAPGQIFSAKWAYVRCKIKGAKATQMPSRNLRTKECFWRWKWRMPFTVFIVIHRFMQASNPLYSIHIFFSPCNSGPGRRRCCDVHRPDAPRQKLHPHLRRLLRRHQDRVGRHEHGCTLLLRIFPEENVLC